MRHATRVARLSKTSEHREALLANMAKNILRHGRIRTTLTKGKEAKRVIDRLITLGKEGSVHSRRRAYRLLQDRGLVKRLFAEIAPQYLNCQGGYTRLLRLSTRPGDGAQLALLELTRLPIEIAPGAPKAKAKTAQAPKTPAASEAKTQSEESPKKPRGFFEGLRERFRPKKESVQS